jgi:hypothetical protein
VPVDSALDLFSLRASAENGSNTPDFILAQYLTSCLAAFDEAVNAREKWYGREPQFPYNRGGVVEQSP